MAKKGLLNIGFGNMVVAGRVVAILAPGSSPMNRLREESKKAGRLIDATRGRKCRSIVLLDSEHLILSANKVETLYQRFEDMALEFEGLEKELGPSASQ